MLQTWHRIALTWALIALLSGCAGLGAIRERPSVTLAGIRVIEIGRLEQKFGLVLQVRNPNDAEIPISGLIYEVEVNGVRFVSGVSDKAVTIPHQGDAMLEVSAVSNVRSLLRQLAEFRKEGRQSIAYRLKGELRTGQFGVVVPFDRKGEVALPEFLGTGGGGTTRPGI